MGKISFNIGTYIYIFGFLHKRVCLLNYALFQALFIADVLQSLNADTRYLYPVGHQGWFDEHLVSPSFAFGELARVAFVVIEVIVSLCNSNDLVEFVAGLE